MQNEDDKSETIASEQIMNQNENGNNNNLQQSNVENEQSELKEDTSQENENDYSQNNEDDEEYSAQKQINQNKDQQINSISGTTSQQQTSNKRNRRNLTKSNIDLDTNTNRETSPQQTMQSTKRGRGRQPLTSAQKQQRLLQQQQKQLLRQQQLEEMDQDGQGKKRNEFWKYRHTAEYRKKREEDLMLQQQQNQQILIQEQPQFTHVSMENMDEFMRASILKAQEYNDRIYHQRLQMRKIFQQQQREEQTSQRHLDQRNMKFPDCPVYIYDSDKKSYYSSKPQIKENKGTIEQFIHLNVQHENNLMYMNDLARGNSFLSKSILKNKKKQRKKKRDQQLEYLQQSASKLGSIHSTQNI